jgi:SAM-dependent methyltransferase
MSDDTLVEWKTQAWQNPQMVAWYHGRMEEGRGTNRLKNELETGYCRELAVGERILDIGVGTGRASLPLARDGRQVTGIDSSQAMLDQCRANAGETPIDLRLGDVARLPFADGQFDTALGLNVVVHFPHVRDILAEWKRVVRPGGRLLFDIYSDDHERVACAAKGMARPERAAPLDYFSLIRLADLAGWADQLGLRIVAVRPYGGLLTGLYANLWRRGSRAESHDWERLMTWMAVDRRMLDFALFLEREVIAHLPSSATYHLMVALEATPDPAANAAWLRRDAEIGAALQSELTWPAVSSLMPAWNADWRAQLNAHLDWPRNRVLLFLLWSGLWRHAPGFDLASFLEERHAARLYAWLQAEMTDAIVGNVLRMLEHWPPLAERFSHNQVPMWGALEYDLTRELLRGYYQVGQSA